MADPSVPPRLSSPRWQDVLEAVGHGGRPPLESWLVLAKAPLPPLLEAASRIREGLHPDRRVGYVVDRNVNYTNVCTAGCSFCAFHRQPGAADAVVLSTDEIHAKVDEAVRLGASGILLQGGLDPSVSLARLERLLAELKLRHRIYLHGFSPPEIVHLSGVERLSVTCVLGRLRDAGLDSMPGGGAEILVDRVRSKLTTKCSASEWLGASEAAHRLGIATTATMVMGLGETDLDRLAHFEEIRALQARSGGVLAFIPWTFQPGCTPLGRTIESPPAPGEYLRWLALARLFLDNVANLQVSRVTQGTETARAGLEAGANDIGSTMIEENVVTAAGTRTATATEADVVRTIEAAGFVPVRRNAGYVRLFDRDRGPLVDPSTLPAGPRPTVPAGCEPLHPL